MKPPTRPKHPLVSKARLCEEIGISKSVVDRLVRLGKITPALIVEDVVRFITEDVRAQLAAETERALNETRKANRNPLARYL